MAKEYQVIVYDDEDEILSSQHYDDEPTDELLEELLSEGVRLECYLVDGDHYSKFIFSAVK